MEQGKAPEETSGPQLGAEPHLPLAFWATAQPQEGETWGGPSTALILLSKTQEQVPKGANCQNNLQLKTLRGIQHQLSKEQAKRTHGKENRRQPGRWRQDQQATDTRQVSCTAQGSRLSLHFWSQSH